MLNITKLLVTNLWLAVLQSYYFLKLYGCSSFGYFTIPNKCIRVITYPC